MTRQIGGDHYQGEYGHWDWVSDIGLGYLAGCATKYLVRWRRKNGRQDLEKALTYVQKMREVGEERWGSVPIREQDFCRIQQQTLALANSLHVPETEHRVCLWIATANISDDLIEAESAIEQMLSEEDIFRGHPDPTGTGHIDHPAPFGYTEEDA